jgi:hypothetical protein
VNSKIGPFTGNKAVISPRQAMTDLKIIRINLKVSRSDSTDQSIVPTAKYEITATPGPAMKMAFPAERNNPLQGVRESVRDGRYIHDVGDIHS